MNVAFFILSYDFIKKKVIKLEIDLNEIIISGTINKATDNKIQSFITVTDISDNQNEIMNVKKSHHIRYDSDGIEIWVDKRCKVNLFEEDDPEYIKLVEMLKEFE